MLISWQDAFATGSRPGKSSIRLDLHPSLNVAYQRVGWICCRAWDKVFLNHLSLCIFYSSLANHPVPDVLATVPLYRYVASALSTESSMASSCSSTPGSTLDIPLPEAKFVFSEKVVMVKLRYRCGHRYDSSMCSKTSTSTTTSWGCRL